MKDHLSKLEIRKDAVQNSVEAAASTVGEVTTIITTAVADVAKAIGGLATEVFEIRQAARRALAEASETGVELTRVLRIDPQTETWVRPTLPKTLRLPVEPTRILRREDLP